MPTPEALSGILLILSTLVGGAWDLGLRITGRQLSDAPFETWPQHARAMRWTVSVWILAALLSLMGFAVLSSLLDQVPAPGLGRVGLVLLTLSVVFVILEGTHHMTVGIWSAEEYLRTGTRPAFSVALNRWANTALQTSFYLLWLAGLAFYGWALLVSELLPVWAGWTAVAWSLLWLGAFAARRTVWTWALVVPVQLVVGSALLFPL